MWTSGGLNSLTKKAYVGADVPMSQVCHQFVKFLLIPTA